MHTRETSTLEEGEFCPAAFTALDGAAFFLGEALVEAAFLAELPEDEPPVVFFISETARSARLDCFFSAIKTS